jgi:hypothetical protein
MYKTGSELKIRWALQYEVGGSSLQWCEGKMMPFSVGSYIMGPDMIESACFWSVSGVVKVWHFYWLPPWHGIFYISWQGVHLCVDPQGCAIQDVVMSPTLDVFRCLLVTYLAALRWTISILLMSDLRWGSHTEQAYSSDGLTKNGSHVDFL